VKSITRRGINLNPETRWLTQCGDRARLRNHGMITIYGLSSFGRTTWPRRDQRAGLTAFFPNLEPAGCVMRAPTAPRRVR
jgi:hypothetical protein